MRAARGLRSSVFIALCGLICIGCETAHYVVRGPENGVVAIPRDTPELRAKAEKLMHEQFPAGYVIDDVRDVAVGRPYRTITQVGPFAEVETHRRHEVMLYYHSGLHALAVPAQPLGPVATSQSPVVNPTVVPASAVVPSGAPAGLPPQPVPVHLTN